MDVSPLYRRVDAHPGGRPGGTPWAGHSGADCFHFCANPTGPLRLIPILLHHMLLSLPAPKARLEQNILAVS